MLPTTADRVPLNTSREINAQIRREARERVAHYRNASPGQIEERLHALDAEWDVERAIGANASSIALVGIGLGAFVNRKFLILPGVVAGFLLQHALQGWCPPIPILRRMGFRTQTEIAEERYALKALRGDFDLPDDPAPHEVFNAVVR